MYAIETRFNKAVRIHPHRVPRGFEPEYSHLQARLLPRGQSVLHFFAKMLVAKRKSLAKVLL